MTVRGAFKAQILRVTAIFVRLRGNVLKGASTHVLGRASAPVSGSSPATRFLAASSPRAVPKSVAQRRSLGVAAVGLLSVARPYREISRSKAAKAHIVGSLLRALCFFRVSLAAWRLSAVSRALTRMRLTPCRVFRLARTLLQDGRAMKAASPCGVLIRGAFIR